MAEKLKFCTLFSGSSGNCTYIKYGNDEILIDAGKNAKCICKALEEVGTSIDNIKAIFITHEHSDHTSALKVLTKKRNIPVYVPRGCTYKMKDICPECMCSRQVPFEERVGGITIRSFKTPHDSDDSAGYIADFGDYTDRSFYAYDRLFIKDCSEEIEVVDFDFDSVTIRANSYVHAVELEGECVFSDNYFSLMAGEEKTVTWKQLGENDDFGIYAYTLI